MIKLTVIMITLLITVIASASTGGEHEGVPTALIWHQAFNVTILFLGLFWFLRHPVRAHFSQRRAAFTEAASKAAESRKVAEEEKSHIEGKLAHLEATTQESLSRARAEAADLKNSILKEAHELALRIKADSEMMIKVEMQKAKNGIREEIIKESVKLTRSQIADTVTGDDHDRLQKRFVDELQVVQ